MEKNVQRKGKNSRSQSWCAEGARGCVPFLGSSRLRHTGGSQIFSVLHKPAEPKWFKIRDVTRLSDLVDDLAARLFWQSPRFHPALCRGSVPAENTTRTAELCCARALGLALLEVAFFSGTMPLYTEL